MQKYLDCKMPGGGTLGGVLSMLESRLGISYVVAPISCGGGECGKIRVEYDITLARNMRDIGHDERWYTYYITEDGDMGTFSCGQSDKSNTVAVTFYNAESADSGLICILGNERAMNLVFGLPPIKSENQLRMILDIRGK